MPPTIVSIQVGMPRIHGDAGAPDSMDQPWRSGFYKNRIAGRVRVSRTNIFGDGQADLKNHGGIDKAILCYSADHYPTWRELLNIADFPHGAFGENLTIQNLNESSVCIGDTWRVGDVVLQVSQPRQPCWKLGRRWRMEDLPKRVIENGRSGWYVRVLQEGTIEDGMTMNLIDRPNLDWSIARANRLMFHDRANLGDARELSELRFLSDAWRRHFATRVASAAR
jgi:MOSC domain-containing protein YiiM